jgi:hypothetical protein
VWYYVPATRGRERDRAAPHALALRAVGPELEARGDGLEHLAHLERRERRPEAAARAAAEGDERVRLGGAVQEALRPERGRIVPEFRAAVVR